MRTVIFSEEFGRCVEELGGYRAVDRSIDPIIDGLSRNPYAFDKFESDEFTFRWAKAKRIGDMPPLFVVFTINEDRTVTLERVEQIPT